MAAVEAPENSANEIGHRFETGTATGTIFYAPNPFEWRPRATPTFPTPHITRRPRRPHTTRIVSYPPGYIPTELRSCLSTNLSNPSNDAHPGRSDSHIRAQRSGINRLRQKRDIRFPRNLILPKPSNTTPTGTRVLEKLLAVFSPQTPSLNASGPIDATTESRFRDTPSIRPSNLARCPSLAHAPNSSEQAASSAGASPDESQNLPVHVLHTRRSSAPPMTRGLTLADRGTSAILAGAFDSSSSQRNSVMSVRSATKNGVASSVSDVTEKPIASGGGISCSIILAEPHIFLAGFDHDGHPRRTQNHASSLLRGKLLLNLTKNVKIRAVTLVLHGRARTDWPEGIPPSKVDLFEEESLRTQALTFFHAMHGVWNTPYGNQCAFSLKPSSDGPLNAALNRLSPAGSHGDTNSFSVLSAKDMKRLSLQQVQSRSFGKGDSPMAHPVQAKGYKVFPPGTYEYSFELPIDHHQLETISLPFGTVKWELLTSVERVGAFKPNLHGSKEISIVRIPELLSLETVEPISISRQWEDQLFYDIVISGRSFSIGGTIPMAIKITPLAKVQLHKLKVYVTESAEYWTNNRRVTRKDPGRKILLFEKIAGRPLDPRYVESNINFLSGGELTNDERAEARAIAARRQASDAQLYHSTPAPLAEPVENLLGDLDLGLESYWGSTEMELNVRMPTCSQMDRDPKLRLHPDCSWKNARIYHWIKVVMRISRLDPTDPGGKRRRHYEISIDSPFTVLSCLATQANTSLPQYSGQDPSSGDALLLNCGCPDATTLSPPRSPAASIEYSPDVQQQQLPERPQAAHVHTLPSGSGISEAGGNPAPSASSTHIANSEQVALEQQARPIHLLRVPSYAPPAFDADETPPVPDDLTTPPPNYDAVVGTPSIDGLADYFSRLADYDFSQGQGLNPSMEDDSDSDEDLHMPARITSPGGRVNVSNPRMYGVRHAPSRSMDIQRPIVPVCLSLRGSRPQQEME